MSAGISRYTLDTTLFGFTNIYYLSLLRGVIINLLNSIEFLLLLKVNQLFFANN